jgi:hypothetical protein
MQVDPRASAALWAPDDSSPLALLPHGYPQLATQCQEPTTTHISDPHASGFAILLVTEHGGPALPTVPDSKSHSSCIKEQECQISPRGEESYNLLLCRWHQKPRFPNVHRSPALHAAPPCRRAMSLLSKRWNPSSSTEWQSATLLVLEGLPPTEHRDPVLPTVTAGEPLYSHQRAGTLAPLLRGGKR